MTTASPTTAARRPRARKGEGAALRDEILAATERLLLERGSAEAVSIRAVADRVGVTPPSIYRHFADKTDLIFEVCARHFVAFDDYLARASAGIDDPVDRLRAIGLAYMRFGLANPEPYRIMFMTRSDETPEEYKAVVLRDNAAFDQVVRCVQECIDAGRFRPEYTDAYPLTIGFWARVHGLTSLLVSKPQFPWPDDREAFIQEYAKICLAGVVRD
ncbi:MAG TPA: TetR/AcrR family transcriptional regulator [Acidimicrobiales bacterium]|jgi:AcrR family transcriptional regulator|nr:TetR/AcrR family transcriptional regulator [Acidimicrobiales bacterium]